MSGFSVVTQSSGSIEPPLEPGRSMKAAGPCNIREKEESNQAVYEMIVAKALLL